MTAPGAEPPALGRLPRLPWPHPFKAVRMQKLTSHAARSLLCESSYQDILQALSTSVRRLAKLGKHVDGAADAKRKRLRLRSSSLRNCSSLATSSHYSVEGQPSIRRQAHNWGQVPVRGDI
eukprot:scaffold6592_cov411-Prasinococcus_capsulatus_cf.AAC.8